jgi:tRNA pseudouridine-54 N-methylase
VQIESGEKFESENFEGNPNFLIFDHMKVTEKLEDYYVVEKEERKIKFIVLVKKDLEEEFFGYKEEVC